MQKVSRKKRLGYSPITERIYLGAHNGEHWLGEKEDITSDFIKVLLEKFPPRFRYGITVDGKVKYEITVREEKTNARKN